MFRQELKVGRNIKTPFVFCPVRDNTKLVNLHFYPSDGFSLWKIFKQYKTTNNYTTFIYSHYLKQKEKSIEGILHSFVNSYLIETFNLKYFRINFPSENTSYLEKVRLIVPEIESILKQYKIFVEEGVIDHELLQLSSQSIVYGEIPSLSDKKYVYGLGNEFLKLKYYFFSDQSMLFYIEPFKEKYNVL